MNVITRWAKPYATLGDARNAESTVSKARRRTPTSSSLGFQLAKIAAAENDHASRKQPWRQAKKLIRKTNKSCVCESKNFGSPSTKAATKL